MTERRLTVKDQRNADIMAKRSDADLLKSLRWAMSAKFSSSFDEGHMAPLKTWNYLREADFYRLLLWDRGVLPMVDGHKGRKIRCREEAEREVRESVRRGEWFKLDLAEAYRKMGYGHNSLKDFMREDLEPRPERDEWFPDLVERHRAYLAECAEEAD